MDTAYRFAKSLLIFSLLWTTFYSMYHGLGLFVTFDKQVLQYWVTLTIFLIIRILGIYGIMSKNFAAYQVFVFLVSMWFLNAIRLSVMAHELHKDVLLAVCDVVLAYFVLILMIKNRSKASEKPIHAIP
ncbi:hypothetical protein HDE_04782 [Halotydeus destructor]|nr:hypothetical protein HDE_04782 [Halotydeus destructor]